MTMGSASWWGLPPGGLHPGDGCGGVCIQGGLPSGGSTSRRVCLQGGLHLVEGLGRPPEIHGLLWDTVNKWAVRILLECIPVLFIIFSLAM